MDFTKTISMATPNENPALIEVNFWRRLFQYFSLVVLGIISGGTGVALVLGLVIVLRLAGGLSFAPGTILIAIVASGLGVGLTRLLVGVAHRARFFNTFQPLDQNCLQTALVFSVLTALLQTFLYLHNVAI